MTTDQLTAQIAAVLRGAGLTDKPAEYDSDIHGWRCSHPDIYGPCDCFAELVNDLTALIAVRVGGGGLRAGVAAAWFAGYDKGNLDGYFGTSDERRKSPYADLDPYDEHGNLRALLDQRGEGA